MIYEQRLVNVFLNAIRMFIMSVDIGETLGFFFKVKSIE